MDFLTKTLLRQAKGMIKDNRESIENAIKQKLDVELLEDETRCVMQLAENRKGELIYIQATEDSEGRKKRILDHAPAYELLSGILESVL